MKKAFIFDLDGVLIDDESIWENEKEKIYLQLFGKELMTKMGSTLGINMDRIYELAKKQGSTLPKEILIKAFYDKANKIYKTAPIPNRIEELIQVLKEYDFFIGIVSASPKEWIDIVTKRIQNSSEIALVLSLFDRPDLPHKPAPDGYREAIKSLGSTPQHTIILEDSNAGIASGKAAGAYVIGLRLNLVKGYVQDGADRYVDTIQDVIHLIKNDRLF
jgi:sugar-phosphatase